MEVITLSFPLTQEDRQEFPPLAMALGYFDGVHLGHQEVILEAKKQAEAKGIHSAVMTFDPHPSVVLGNKPKKVQYISSLSQKVNLISELGIDYLFVVKFTRGFASLMPQEFIDEFIIGLNVRHVVAGFDFTYGRFGKGTMETLPLHSRDMFSVTIVPKFTVWDEKVSSTRIRQLIAEGKLEDISELLGRYYSTTGVVIHGDNRGKSIGFPTANVAITDEQVIPPVGVYAVRFKVLNKWYEGVCNVGYKPTFNNEAVSVSVEVHLFDFDQDIYGEIVVIEWRHFLRNEQKFAGIEELVQQINQDKQASLAYFNKIRQS